MTDDICGNCKHWKRHPTCKPVQHYCSHPTASDGVPQFMHEWDTCHKFNRHITARVSDFCERMRKEKE